MKTVNLLKGFSGKIKRAKRWVVTQYWEDPTNLVLTILSPLVLGAFVLVLGNLLGWWATM